MCCIEWNASSWCPVDMSSIANLCSRRAAFVFAFPAFPTFPAFPAFPAFPVFPVCPTMGVTFPALFDGLCVRSLCAKTDEEEEEAEEAEEEEEEDELDTIDCWW